MESAGALSVTDSARAIAKAMGRTEATADTTVRTFQRNDPPLCENPRGRGGGKNKALHSLQAGTNLVFGFADTGLVLNKPPLVLAYRVAPVLGGAGWPMHVDPAVPDEFAEALRGWHKAVLDSDPDWPSDFRLVPGETQGEAMDNLADWLARPEGQRIRHLFRLFGFWWDIGVGYPHPPCSIGCATEAGTFRTYYIPRGRWPSAPGADMAPGMTTTARIHFKVFELLADLWAEARPRQVGFPVSSPASANPADAERKSAGQGVTSTLPTPLLDHHHGSAPATGPSPIPEGSARARYAQAANAGLAGGHHPPSRKSVRYEKRPKAAQQHLA